MDSVHNESDVWQVSVDSSGRVLLPAALRNDMGANTGATLLWVRDENGLHLKSFDDSLAQIQDYYVGLDGSGRSWSEELLKQRVIEASSE